LSYNITSRYWIVLPDVQSGKQHAAVRRDSNNAVVGLTIITTGSAASSASDRLRTPADISDCAHSAAVSVSGYSIGDVNTVTSSWTTRSVDMATTDHLRPVLQHELTYSDMDAPKGLHNSRGENNCFLNSAVQVTNFHSPSVAIIIVQA